MPRLTNRAQSAAMEIHKTIISAIEKTAQAWAEEHEETETLEINIPGSNVNVFSEIIERHMRDPNTSIVHWTRYDGTLKTMPIKNITVFLIRRGMEEIIFSRLDSDGDWLESQIAYDKHVGDLWAYLPEPPEGIE